MPSLSCFSLHGSARADTDLKRAKSLATSLARSLVMADFVDDEGKEGSFFLSGVPPFLLLWSKPLTVGLFFPDLAPNDDGVELTVTPPPGNKLPACLSLSYSSVAFVSFYSIYTIIVIGWHSIVYHNEGYF